MAIPQFEICKMPLRLQETMPVAFHELLQIQVLMSRAMAMDSRQISMFQLFVSFVNFLWKNIEQSHIEILSERKRQNFQRDILWKVLMKP